MPDVSKPSGWTTVRISDIAIKGEQRKPNLNDVFIYVDIGSIDRDLKQISNPQQIHGDNAPSRARKVIETGDILVSLTRPNLNAVALVTEDYHNQIASTGFEVIKPVMVDSRYIFGLVRSKAFINEISGVVQGALYPAAKSSDVQNFEFPLPPIAEQKVIADKLDILLAQVENTKARLERIPKILKRFRQSVLAAAVSGRLTEEWRVRNPGASQVRLNELKEHWLNTHRAAGKRTPKPNPLDDVEHGEVPDKWLETRIGQVFDVFVGSTPSRSRPDYWNGEIPWVSSSEVAFCRVNSTREHITELGLAGASTTVHPVGTVMLAMIGQGKTRGQVAILDTPACHNQNTAALRVPEGFVEPDYLYYYLVQQYEETRRIGGGNNQKALNKRFVQSMAFPLPPIEEQTEIVRQVDQIFAHADRIEQQVNNALARVNNLTQSILAKAFRGELTEQWRKDNPQLISGENSAEALLARIQAERAAAKPASKTRKRKATA